MDIFFHVGPHKTGTTSIQVFLKRHFGSETPRHIWYPTGDSLGHGGGGHGGLADPFSPRAPLRDTDLGRRRLAAVAEQARAADVSTLLISSENFSFCSAEDLRTIRDILPAARFRLIFTASPLARRFISQWNTYLQFAGIRPIAESGFLTDHAPGFRPGYFDHMIASLRPDGAALIVSDPGAEDVTLLRDFFRECGLPWPDGAAGPDTAKKNVSMDLHASQMLIFVNRLYFGRTNVAANEEPGHVLEDDYLALRKRVLALARSSEWRAIFPRTPLELPEAMRPELARIGEEMRQNVLALVDDGRLRIVGDLETVFADLDLRADA